jgi:hypothetical protein
VVFDFYKKRRSLAMLAQHMTLSLKLGGFEMLHSVHIISEIDYHLLLSSLNVYI